MTKDEICLELTKLVADKVLREEFHSDKEYSKAIAESYNEIHESLKTE
ncbi:hypothetical protein [Faecalicatena contorta]